MPNYSTRSLRCCAMSTVSGREVLDSFMREIDCHFVDDCALLLPMRTLWLGPEIDGFVHEGEFIEESLSVPGIESTYFRPATDALLVPARQQLSVSAIGLIVCIEG